MKKGLTHIDESGKAVMVNVSPKKVVARRAVASGKINMKPETIRLLKKGLLKKGDALGCARIAGILAAKQTPLLIPLCHGIPLDHVQIDFRVGRNSVEITAQALTQAKTGVEMEALAAVSVAALTIYDMCKAVDKEMMIGEIRVVLKEKGE